MGISYRQHGKKNWEYRIKYKDPITQKHKEKSKRGFTSKSEARYAAQGMEKRLLAGIEQSPITLKEYLNTWLTEYKRGTIRKNTFELHERNINNHILPYFKNILLQEVMPIMYQKFLNHLSDQGYSRRTVEIIHGTMYNAFEKAVIIKKVEDNPCKGVSIKGKDKDREIKFIDSNNIPLFLQEAYKYDYIYWIFFKILIETGMRKGEAAALQWPDIDLKERTININKSLDFQPRDMSELFGDTKTFHSKRIITMSQSLTNDLHFHKKYQNQNKLALNEVYHHDLNLVLCRNDGNFMPKSSLFNAFSRILKKAGLPSLPIHSTRHTHAVLQLEAGADMKYIQERLGHGSIQITADVYAHISKKIDQNTMNKFEEYTKNILR
ncbi:tyrosine-type recombinase/integrase [Lederbergia citrea]|uniref:tyrosine-type recombinase/integrase n=1 Tax=Lederbergia citrea TaxID=2833581 RepID=UPI001BC974B4|nr:tyrosine-type recombinase/integrase [Lederbergia citrea]MBS4203695.1 site-specific integrase [Lederbergia citrea]